METNKNNWSIGEFADIPRTERKLTKRGSTTYMQYVSSGYLCIREEKNGQRGMLLKVLGRSTPEYVSVKAGQPFCKDDREELFYGTRYFSYPFNSAKRVGEVIAILRDNPKLLQQLEHRGMHVNLNAKFWVKDTKRTLWLRKKAQVFDPATGELEVPTGNDPYYRLSIVCFYKGELIL